MIAVGGWGDTVGFSEATKSEAGMRKFATDVATMLQNTQTDGVGEYSNGLRHTVAMLNVVRYRLGIPRRQRCRLQAEPE
jgi:GH18 family chitinase